jgi:hypothetical protein
MRAACSVHRILLYLVVLIIFVEEDDALILATMKATRTSETSVNIYQTTRRNNIEGSHLHTRRRKNLKPHLEISGFHRISLFLRLL